MHHIMSQGKDIKTGHSGQALVPNKGSITLGRCQWPKEMTINQTWFALDNAIKYRW